LDVCCLFFAPLPDHWLKKKSVVYKGNGREKVLISSWTQKVFGLQQKSRNNKARIGNN
jgi:hypothetical protein